MNIDNLEKWHFEITEKSCNHLLDLVSKVHKKATPRPSSFDCYYIKNEAFPKIGSLSALQ